MNKGLTLIETVLYITLLSFLIVVAIPILIDLNTWRSKQIANGDAISEFLFLEGKVGSLIKNSDSVERPEVGDFSEELKLNHRNGDTVRVFENDGIVLMQTDSHEFMPLHSSSTNISNINFYRPLSRVDQILFNMTINNFNFGTTSYLIYNEE